MERFDIGENVFWLRLWITLALFFATVILGAQFYYHNQNLIIQEMVKAGANPMDIRCMGASSTDPICLTRR